MSKEPQIIQKAATPGSAIRIYNKRKETTHLRIDLEDGTSIRLLNIPGHCVELTVGKTAPNIVILDTLGEDLVGIPSDA